MHVNKKEIGRKPHLPFAADVFHSRLLSAPIKRMGASEKRHPDRHTCPFPVSVYYAAMILL